MDAVDCLLAADTWWRSASQTAVDLLAESFDADDPVMLHDLLARCPPSVPTYTLAVGWNVTAGAVRAGVDPSVLVALRGSPLPCSDRMLVMLAGLTAADLESGLPALPAVTMLAGLRAGPLAAVVPQVCSGRPRLG